MPIDFKYSAENFSEIHSTPEPLLLKNSCNTNNFTWRQANQIFEQIDALTESLKLLFNGIVPKEKYVESYLDVGFLRHRLIKPVIYDFMTKGATLIANHIKNQPSVDILARKIGSFTGRQVVASAYASFGNFDSFRAHWDTRDIFAIQILGRKRWLVYRPTFELPLYSQQSKDYEKYYPKPEEIYMDFILEPGDVFYLPRGWWHNPLPLGEETFHLSFGTFPPFAIDYLSWAIKESQNCLAARKALGTWALSQDIIQELASHFSTYISNPENYQKFQDSFNSEIRLDSSLAINILGDSKKQFISDNQKLRITTNNIHDIGSAYLIANGNKINLDNIGAKLINRIAKSPGILLSELLSDHPDIEANKIRKLITELCRQDILDPQF